LERKTRFVGPLKRIAYQAAVILEWLTNMRASKKRSLRFDNSDYATSFQNAKLLQLREKLEKGVSRCSTSRFSTLLPQWEAVCIHY